MNHNYWSLVSTKKLPSEIQFGLYGTNIKMAVFWDASRYILV